MLSSGMFRRVVLTRTDISEEHIASIIRMSRVGELGTTSAVTDNRSMLRLIVTANVDPSSPILVTLMMEAIFSFETSVPTRAARHDIPEDGIIHCHRREDLKSYTVRLCCLKELTSVCC
jgi:hypothetical protein